MAKMGRKEDTKTRTGPACRLFIRDRTSYCAVLLSTSTVALCEDAYRSLELVLRLNSESRRMRGQDGTGRTDDERFCAL